MAQGFYTLEEAAKILGTGTEDLSQMAEHREVRGFADRGTWRFRAQDIEELARRLGREGSLLTEQIDLDATFRAAEQGAQAPKKVPRPEPAHEAPAPALACDLGGGTTDLTLIAVGEEGGQLAPLEDEALAGKEGEKDIFETDFPALEAESGSQAAVLGESKTDAIESYEKRLSELQQSRTARDVERLLTEAAENRRLMAALMDDNWLGMELLHRLSESGQGMTATALSKKLKERVDQVAGTLARLVRYGAVDVTAELFACSERGEQVVHKVNKLVPPVDTLK